MKVIFLDIDGVLNCFSDYMVPSKPTHEWDPSAMQKCGINLDLYPTQVRRVNKLIEKTGAKIVLSTSWRKGDETWWNNLLITLEGFGLLPVIIGKIPDLRTSRGEEVQAYLDEHPEVIQFVILDDINEFTEYNLLDNFIQTNYQLGIQDKDVERALEILNAPAYVGE